MMHGVYERQMHYLRSSMYEKYCNIITELSRFDTEFITELSPPYSFDVHGAFSEAMCILVDEFST